MSEMLSTISKVHAEKRRSERSADECLPKRFKLCTGHKRVQEQACNVWNCKQKYSENHICIYSVTTYVRGLFLSRIFGI